MQTVIGSIFLLFFLLSVKMPIPRNNPEPISVDDITEETKGFIKKVIDDVGKSNASKQLVLGGASGW